MSEPTSGPYIVTGQCPDGLVITRECPTHAGGIIVATVRGPERHVVNPETRATADLLAAAWEMKAALECEHAMDRYRTGYMSHQEAMAILDRHGFPGVAKISAQSFIRRLCVVALAKARGEGMGT